jgi:RNA polymerase subunit RPABC4/transcription elongation factor Spt4
VSNEQPIDLDDLRRVAVKVREKTDDNWLADMVELACDEISRLREDNDEQCRLHGVGSQRELRQLAVIEEQAREIARLREERRWVSVGERLPEDNVGVLAWGPCNGGAEMVWREHGKWHLSFVGTYIPDSTYTHWMPLPPGPEGDG